MPKNSHSWDSLYPLMCFLRLESFFSGHLQTFWKELCVQRQQLLETLSGNPEDQNYFHNNTEMEQDPKDPLPSHTHPCPQPAFYLWKNVSQRLSLIREVRKCQERIRLEHGRPGFNCWVGNIPWTGNDYPLQYSGLENSMDYIVHGVTKSRMLLSHFHFHWIHVKFWGFSSGASGKEPACQCSRHKRHTFDPCVGTIPWRRARQPIPVYLPGESPWTLEPGRLQSTELQRGAHDWSNLARSFILDKETTTHSSIRAWRIPWTEDPGRLQSYGVTRVGHDWATKPSPPVIIKYSQRPLVSSQGLWNNLSHILWAVLQILKPLPCRKS